jgi:hypothetical protein
VKGVEHFFRRRKVLPGRSRFAPRRAPEAPAAVSERPAAASERLALGFHWIRNCGGDNITTTITFFI